MTNKESFLKDILDNEWLNQRWIDVSNITKKDIEDNSENYQQLLSTPDEVYDSFCNDSYKREHTLHDFSYQIKMELIMKGIVE